MDKMKRYRDEVGAFQAGSVMSVKALREGTLDMTQRRSPVWLKHVVYKNFRSENCVLWELGSY